MSGNNDKIKNGKFEKGDILKFEGLQNKPNMNGSYGLVKKCMDDGKLRVAVNAKHDIAIETKFCKKVTQCQNESVKNVPCLIWPLLKGENYPRANWVYELPSRLFPLGEAEYGHEYGFLEMRIQGRWIPENLQRNEIMSKQLELDNMHPKDILKHGIHDDAVQLLKSTLNWSEPKFRAISRSGLCVMAWYDRKSNAEVNALMDKLMNLGTPEYEKPRGAVLYFDYWKFAAPSTGQCSLNQLIYQSYGKVQLPQANDKPELDEKLKSIIGEHASILVKSKVCPSVNKKTSKLKCKNCKDKLKRVGRLFE